MQGKLKDTCLCTPGTVRHSDHGSRGKVTSRRPLHGARRDWESSPALTSLLLYAKANCSTAQPLGQVTVNAPSGYFWAASYSHWPSISLLSHSSFICHQAGGNKWGTGTGCSLGSFTPAMCPTKEQYKGHLGTHTSILQDAEHDGLVPIEQ